jgi:hypothetical protein
MKVLIAYYMRLIVYKLIDRFWVFRNSHKIVRGREVFQIFLIGSALSVIYAFVGAKMVNWFANNLLFAVIFPLCLILGTLLLYGYLLYKHEPSPKDSKV